MAADDDVLDLEDIDRELQHRQAVDVGVADHVGDVAVDEQLAGDAAHDLVGRQPAVGAADPQQLGPLHGLEPREELGVARGGGGGPAPVGGEAVVEEAHPALVARAAQGVASAAVAWPR